MLSPLSLRQGRRPIEAVLADVLGRCEDERASRLAADLGASAPEVLEHGAGVAGLALAMGRLAGLGPDRVAVLARAALLHDVGKRYVPRDVLDRPGPLRPHERQVVQAHPSVGASMLLEAGFVEESAIVRHHHERWDGSGYPDRLFGEAIPLESRLILVADAFDAMTSDRAYRAALGTEVAVREVAVCAGTQFDPACAALLPEVLGMRV